MQASEGRSGQKQAIRHARSGGLIRATVQPSLLAIPIDFAWGKLAGKASNGHTMTVGCCYNCHKCKLVVKHSDCNCHDCEGATMPEALRNSCKYRSFSIVATLKTC